MGPMPVLSLLRRGRLAGSRPFTIMRAKKAAEVSPEDAVVDQLSKSKKNVRLAAGCETTGYPCAICEMPCFRMAHSFQGNQRNLK